MARSRWRTSFAHAPAIAGGLAQLARLLELTVLHKSSPRRLPPSAEPEADDHGLGHGESSHIAEIREFCTPELLSRPSCSRTILRDPHQGNLRSLAENDSWAKDSWL